MLDRLECAAHFLRWIGIERLILRFDGAATARKGPAAIALRDEPPDTDFARRQQKQVGSFRSQAIGLGKGTIEMRKVGHSVQAGHLVNDDFGLERRERPPDRRRIEHVGDDRLRARALDRFRPGGRAGKARDGVAGRYQLWNQFAPDGAGCPRNENTHVLISRRLRLTAGSRIKCEFKPTNVAGSTQ
jgi:hypothetical protein